MALMGDVLLLYEILDTYNIVKDTGSVDVAVRRAMMIVNLTYDNNKLLKACKESLARGIISDSFDSDFWTEHYARRTIKGGCLEKAIKKFGNVLLKSLGITFGVGECFVKVVRDFRDLIENGLEEMNQLLEDVEMMMGDISSDKYAQFYFARRDGFDDGPFRRAYLNWKIEQRELSIPILRSRQNEALNEFLNSKVIIHDKPLKGWEKKNLDIDSFVIDLPIDSEMTDELTNRYAMMNRYIKWVDELMLVDYERYGRFVCSCFNKLSKEKLIALFKFDITLNLIHQDMLKLKPELAKHLPQYTPMTEDSNHFAIVKSITVKMERFWSEKVITDKRFNLSFIEHLLNELLDSEWGKAIVQDWRIMSKRDKLECKIIGAMKDAGISGFSYNALAPIISQIEKIPDSIANYLGQGKDEPYFDWICEYVRG